jgi:hypothetical protein
VSGWVEQYKELWSKCFDELDHLLTAMQAKKKPRQKQKQK